MRHVAVLAATALLVVTPAAPAKDLLWVEGQYFALPAGGLTVVEHSKNVCVIEMPLSFVLTESLVGPFDVMATLNVKKLPEGMCRPDVPPPVLFAATANIRGQGSFSGALHPEPGLDGLEGGFDGTLVAWHDGGLATGRIVIKHGTGDLTGLHGILHLDGVLSFPPVPGGYTGELHFDRGRDR